MEGLFVCRSGEAEPELLSVEVVEVVEELVTGYLT